MPVQSLDLSTVTDATFDGSAVEQINLNGSGIWTMPVSSSKLMTTIDLNSGSACGVIGSATPQLGWLTTGSNVQVPDGYAIEVDTPVGGANNNNFHLVTSNGEVYIGVNVGTFPAGANISLPTKHVDYGIRVQSNNDCGQNAVATSFAWANTYYLMAKMTPNGLEPTGASTNSYASTGSSVDMYGNPVTTYSQADWVITSTTYKQRIYNEQGMNPNNPCSIDWNVQYLWNWCYTTTMTPSSVVEGYFTFA